MHTVPYNEQSSDILAPYRKKLGLISTSEWDEFVVEKILKHKKERRKFPVLTYMKGTRTYFAR